MEISKPLDVIEEEPGERDDCEDDERGGHEQHRGLVHSNAHDGSLACREGEVGVGTIPVEILHEGSKWFDCQGIHDCKYNKYRKFPSRSKYKWP